MMNSAPRPHFQPHFLLRLGHLQTLAGFFLPRPAWDETAQRHVVPVSDGDQIVLHDDCPPQWQPADRTALLVHGLSGSHASPYMMRIARKLNGRGIRTFRMDLRGCGAGLALARLPYHSGRSDDTAAALAAIAQLCPQSPTSLVGFSLGGTISLNLLADTNNPPPPNLDRCLAICPPIDLAASVAALRIGANRLYDRFFVRTLLQQMDAQLQVRPDSPRTVFARPPRGMGEFDNAYTAPICGFGTAENYYRQCSPISSLPEVRLPTLILAAADDPLVPRACFDEARLSPTTALHITQFGGHLGFIGGTRENTDRRWMDWRVVEWVASHD